MPNGPKMCLVVAILYLFAAVRRQEDEEMTDIESEQSCLDHGQSESRL